MEVAFDEIALKDLKIWKQSGKKAVQKKTEKLILVKGISIYWYRKTRSFKIRSFRKMVKTNKR